MTRWLVISVLLAAAVEGMAVARAPVETAILAALDSEINGLKKEVELVGHPLQFSGRTIYQARFNGARVLLAKTGSTPKAARAMAQWLVEERHVARVISIGPAGALSDNLKTGDLVSAQTCRRVLQSTISPAVAASSLLQGEACALKSARVIVSVESFVATSAERGRLRETYQADLVDMSAADIAEVCATREVPYVIIREITDRADEDAPRAFADVVRREEPRTVAAAMCALRDFAGVASNHDLRSNANR
jgi:adenosylhomocysteine nucleosidase